MRPEVDRPCLPAWAAALSLALALNCAGPYYERAAITEGFSGGVGVGVTAGDRVTQQYNDIDAPTVDVRDVSGLGTAFVRYGWSNSIAAYLQGTAGRGAWDHKGVIQGAEDLDEQLTEVQVGVKFRAGRSGAVKAGIGLPGLLDVAYLRDFGRPLTALVGFGMRGLSLGVTNHLNITPTIVQHVSLTFTANPPSITELAKTPRLFGAFLGLGWEFMTPQPEETDDLSPSF